jgi:hypothetical protein
MKSFLVFSLLLTLLTANSQYYYKDIIGTRETADLIKTYRSNKVSRVLLNSYDAENTKNDDFYVEQVFSLPNQFLRTTTRSGVTNESVLVSFTDANGNVIKTIDSSETIITTSVYNYNEKGMLQSVISTSTDTAHSINQTEEHRWEYDNDKIVRMLRIKDKMDTAYISFKLDDKGNIVEEQSVRKGITSEPVYYYYDGNNRLTDIVRFSNKAKRLLPEYLFEYSPSNQVIQKITVPANSSEYLIWRYQYDEKGLKIKEAVFDKHKQLTGKIEYIYQFGS